LDEVLSEEREGDVSGNEKLKLLGREMGGSMRDEKKKK